MADLIRISRGCEYAISAMKVIARLDAGETLQAEGVAEKTGCPAKFTANLLTHLTKSGLLEVSRAASRGYRLGRTAEEISLLDIIEAIDGDFEKPWCFMDSTRKCDSAVPCELHATWTGIRESVRKTLTDKRLSHMLVPNSTAKPGIDL